jgi:penicillin-binding protein 1A
VQHHRPRRRRRARAAAARRHAPAATAVAADRVARRRAEAPATAALAAAAAGLFRALVPETGGPNWYTDPVRYVVSFARSAVVVALFVVAALAGILSGVLFAYAGDLPEISALDNYNPNIITRVYADDGQVIGEFARERRVVVGYDEISPLLRQAIIAAEDGDFDSHFGLSISRLAVTAVRDVVEFIGDKLQGRRSRPAGASTLTQQLARNLLPEAVGFREGDLSPERKIREILVAIQIEKRYTKREILTLYANQMYWGHGAYGVEAASRLYFGKAAKDVALEEAALIAGIIQGNVRQSPYVNMDAALWRRNYALDRMAAEGFVSRAQADEAKAKPIVTRGEPSLQQPSVAPYFVEEVRKHLEQEYGAKALYESGLAVRTTLDVRLQEIANREMDRGLRRIEKRRGFRRPQRNVVAEGHTVEGFHDPRWDRPMGVGDIVPAVVAVLGTPANGATLRLGGYRAELTRPGFRWTGRTSAASLFKVGDLIEVEITGLEQDARTATATLEQTPLVEGALIAIENRTGEIKAMVGGWRFSRSKFNRATQAFRQLGSTFKPVVFTAAIDRGLTPASIIVDEPVTYPAGRNQEYSPQNYDHTFEGPITLRRALEQSRNIPAIKMMERLGPMAVVDYARQFGFSQRFPPYLPIALGAGDGTLVEVTSAYTVFPNQGVRMTPFLIESVTGRGGNLLEENRAEPRDVIRADTAYVMTNILRGVVQRGTAQSAAQLNWPLAGKTGTVDNNTDAWFVGFDPDITVGVWTGLDEKKPLGASETGAVAALPIWIEFMRGYIEARADKDNPPQFEAPGNIVFLPIDRASGTPTPGDMPGTIVEAFIAGTQPGGFGGFERD